MEPMAQHLELLQLHLSDAPELTQHLRIVLAGLQRLWSSLADVAGLSRQELLDVAGKTPRLFQAQAPFSALKLWPHRDMSSALQRTGLRAVCSTATELLLREMDADELLALLEDHGMRSVVDQGVRSVRMDAIDRRTRWHNGGNQAVNGEGGAQQVDVDTKYVV